MNRRELLKTSVAFAALGFHARLLAAPEKQQGRLLFVFLRGAYDAASALVPIRSEFYYAARPTLAIPRPDAGNPLAAVRLDGDWGLHPELARGLAPLLAKKQVVFVPFSGVPNASRSHFQVQDLIEAGDDGRRLQRNRDGMLYRLAVQTGVDTAISYTPSLPLVLRGDRTVANIALNRAPMPRPAEEMAMIVAMYADHPLGEMLQTAEALRARADNGDELAREMQAAGRGAAPAVEFSRHAEKIATFMRSDFHLGFVDVGGWDTHVAQGGSSGTLARQFAGLADGLAVFANAMGREWQNTQVVVMSEFGRTFRENGSGGTDHGHGSVSWILGGKISGVPVRGPRLELTESNLNEQRDYPVLVDYRSVLAESAGITFGLSAQTLTGVFGVAPGEWLKG